MRYWQVSTQFVAASCFSVLALVGATGKAAAADPTIEDIRLKWTE